MQNIIYVLFVYNIYGLVVVSFLHSFTYVYCVVSNRSDVNISSRNRAIFKMYTGGACSIDVYSISPVINDHAALNKTKLA